MKKYIHYCWFGDKPLPKLAKKCIESWKKYLPDYEIIRWSEENVDLEECPFIKGAYENKKWAFVADYARTRALNEMGGIYFDTDMEVTKNIDELTGFDQVSNGKSTTILRTSLDNSYCFEKKKLCAGSNSPPGWSAAHGRSA